MNKCMNDEIMNSFQELEFITICVQVFEKGILMLCGKNNGKDESVIEMHSVIASKQSYFFIICSLGF